MLIQNDILQQDKKFKLLLLNMFEWFHSFCVEHGLRYYMLGGTMLGAARHQGFIPWDDDIDVGMPREDYLKLSKLLKDRTGDRYVLETPDSKNPDFFYTYSKLYDTQTTLVENTRYKIKRGVYLDVFPLDGAGDTKEDALKHLKPIWFRMNLLLTLTTGIRNGRSGYKNVAVRIMRIIPRWILDPKKLLTDIDKRCGSREFEQFAWVGNYGGAWREKEIAPRNVIGDPTLYKFEDKEFYGVEDYEAYLTMLYGNWRELPPVDKQVTHHDYLACDLDSPYYGNGESR